MKKNLTMSLKLVKAIITNFLIKLNNMEDVFIEDIRFGYRIKF